VLVDCRPDTLNIDPDGLERAITPRTRAVIPVHFAGQPCDMDPILEVARRHRLKVIEDAAHSLPARYKGRLIGAISDVTCFSLYATKNITTAEGGVVTTDDDAFADRLRVLRNQGMRARYQYEMAGHNYRMTDLHAAVGIPQLEKLPELTKARQANAEALSSGLAGVPGLRTPAVLPEREHVWHQYTVLVTEDAKVNRDELAAKLIEKGVGCGIYYPKVAFDYDCYREHPGVIAAEVPVARRIATQALSLPVHPKLSEADTTAIVDAVREVLGA
jgi:dTDP-4-amino-4,6-dideoxygalactose transaminase